MKLLFSGAALALTLGALGGHLMHPDLAGRTDRPMGPQMFADWPGEGSTGPFDEGTSFAAAYRVAANGQPPPYIYGTDALRAESAPSETVALTPIRYDDPPAATSADDPALAQEADDTTVAERDPQNPAREPAYDTAPAEAPPADPNEPGGA